MTSVSRDMGTSGEPPGTADGMEVARAYNPDIHVWVSVPNKILTWVPEETHGSILAHFGWGERGSSGGGGRVEGWVEECPALGECAGEESVVGIMEHMKPFQSHRQHVTRTFKTDE